MKTGKYIERNLLGNINAHLGPDKWLEVFPQTAREILTLHVINRKQKTYNELPYKTGQSALLLRADAAERLGLRPDAIFDEQPENLGA